MMKKLLLFLFISVIAISTYAVVTSWSLTAPTERMDGTSLNLNEIQEYRMYVNGAFHKSLPPSGVSITTHDTDLEAEGFGFGSYDVTYRTVDLDGRESDDSIVVTELIKARPNPPTVTRN